MILRRTSLAPVLGLVITLLVPTACASPAVTPGATATATAPTTTTVPTPSAASPSVTATAGTTPAASRYHDAAYEVAGKRVQLTNGLSEVEAAPGSAAKIVTRIFGNEATGDLDGDGIADIGFVLTQSGGGSGTFYYAAAALRTAAGWTGTHAVLLGDRIAPQTTEQRAGVLIVNYAERRPGEPMTAQPSIGVSKYLRVVSGRLVEVDQPR